MVSVQCVFDNLKKIVMDIINSLVHKLVRSPLLYMEEAFCIICCRPPPAMICVEQYCMGRWPYYYYY